MTNPLYDALFAPQVANERTFMHQPTGGSLSHAGFERMAARFAQTFAILGLAPGDRLAVQVEKSPQALALYAACVRSGVVFLPLNTAYTAAEMDYFITDSGAKLVIADTALAGPLRDIAVKSGARLETLDLDRGGSFAALAADRPDSHAVVSRGGDDLAALLYTSGTTGRSKGAMLTQDNLLSNALALVDAWRFGPDDVLLHALPIYHTHGLFVATNVTLAARASMIFQPRFDLDSILDALPHATTLMGVPTFYTRLLGDARLTRDLVAHMRLFVSGSAPLRAETHVEFAERTGHHILERYGMTETNMNTSNPYDGARRAGTVGLPLPGVAVRITDPDSAAPVAVPDGGIGMIEVRGPNVFKGYWRMPEKTAEDLRPDGFFITGDLGRIDTDGYVQIVGRGKDLIITGGFNVYPKEVETVLDAQAGVLESAVVGVPHPDFGEGVIAVLVPQPGAAPDLEAIKTALAANLAKFKQPKRLFLRDALPRNTMGKVQKTVLRDELAESFTA